MAGTNNNKNSKISVILPVYNAGNFLKDAIESILHQTYKNFEFVIVDDASTDGSFQILKEYAKLNRNIKLFRNHKNLGVSETVRKAIDHANGDYLVRMDADDIALPRRIEQQFEYLENHPKTVAVGGQCLTIDSKNRITGKKTFPTEFKEISKYIFRFVPVQQPTLMIARHRLPKNFVFYVDGMNTAEEIELYFKLFKHGKVENLPEIVLLYRIHENNTSLKDIKQTFLLTLIARIKAVFKYGYKPTATGIFYTIFQTVFVLLLPKKIVILLYKLARGTSISSPFSIFGNTSPDLGNYSFLK